MKKPILSLFLIFAITLTGCKKCDDPIPTKNTYEIKLQPGSKGKDALINTYYPDLNQGSFNFMHALAWTISGTTVKKRALIDFDLSSIPSGATINKATLTLYADTTTVYYGNAALQPGHSALSGSNSGTLKQITSSWKESTVTWNTMPDTDPENSIALMQSTSRSQEYQINVLNLIRKQYQYPDSYHGFMIMLDNESYYRSLVFYTSDEKANWVRPSLDIVYTK